MANTYTSVYLHIVFAVKNRESLIPAPWLTRVWSYIRHGIDGRSHKTIAVGGTANHVHILINYKITDLIPDLVRDIKISTSKFIESHQITPYKFAWQPGYGCFSYGASQIEAVSHYIYNQAEHHNGKSLRDEIKNYLDRCGVEYDERYLLEDV